MNILLIARHTRSEEESGRAELVRAASVRTWSALAAVSIVALEANFILGLGTSVVFIVDGQAAGRTLLYGASLTLCGLLFAAIALIWVQVFEYSRAATGASLAVVAVAFALRAIGDVRDSWLSMVSPLGWVQAVNTFGNAAVWPFVVSILVITVAIGVAITFAARCWRWHDPAEAGPCRCSIIAWHTTWFSLAPPTLDACLVDNRGAIYRRHLRLSD